MQLNSERIAVEAGPEVDLVFNRLALGRAAGPAGRCWHYSIVEVRDENVADAKRPRGGGGNGTLTRNKQDSLVDQTLMNNADSHGSPSHGGSERCVARWLHVIIRRPVLAVERLVLKHRKGVEPVLRVVAVERDVRVGPHVPLSAGRRASRAHAQALVLEARAPAARHYPPRADGGEHALVRRGRQAGGRVDGRGGRRDLRELLLAVGVDGRDVLRGEVRRDQGR